MTPRRPPILDPAIARNCTRWLGDHNCGQDAILHVIWDEDMENGFVCAEHERELGTTWLFYAAHAVGPDCAMPGSKFYWPENVCRCDDELLPAEDEPVAIEVQNYRDRIDAFGAGAANSQSGPA